MIFFKKINDQIQGDFDSFSPAPLIMASFSFLVKFFVPRSVILIDIITKKIL